MFLATWLASMSGGLRTCRWFPSPVRLGANSSLEMPISSCPLLHLDQGFFHKACLFTLKMFSGGMSVKPGLYNGRLEQHIHFWLGQETSTDEVYILILNICVWMYGLRLPLLLISLLSWMNTWEAAPSSTERCRGWKVQGFRLSSRRASDTSVEVQRFKTWNDSWWAK